MLKIENTEFKIKFTEINIRQRIYQGKNFITLIITTEFFPSFINESIVTGAIEAKLDIENIHSLDDLVGQKYKGDIGNVTISVNNNGIWEHMSQDNFEVQIKKREGRNLKFTLKTENCKLDTNGTMVSLYTTSSSLKELKETFDLTDFYDKPLEKEVGNNKIIKYFIKE